MELKISNLIVKKMTIAEIVSLISPETFALNLTANSLDSCDPDFLKALFQASTLHLTQLNLSLNNLGKVTGKALALAFSGFGEHIHELNLSVNNFHFQEGKEIAEAFIRFSAGLHTLNLAGNFLGKKGGELKVIFQSLKHIRTLDLSSNCLNLLSLTELQNLKSELSQLEKIYFSYSEIASMPLESRQALCGMVSDKCEIVFLDNMDKVLEDTCESANLIRTIGLKSKVPSLEKQCFFAIEKMKKHPQIKGVVSGEKEHSSSP